MTVEYSETFEQAAEIAESALSLMKERKLPANPNNFAVWFHYHSQRDPNLKRTLDMLLKSGEAITEDQLTEIYEKFFTFEHEGSVLQKATTRINEELGNLLKHLGEAGDGAAEYGKVLKIFSGKLSVSDDTSGLQALVDNIITATRAMEDRNRKLEEKLTESSDEINHLREDLEDMRREAMTDGLTGIPNRKVFDMALRQAARDVEEENDELSLLIADIDHFKKFNDTYGHQVGDQVLRLLANTLVACIKGQDTAARYGGEEFGVILPRTSLPNAVKVAEAIRQRLGHKKVMNRTTGKSLGEIKISIGVGRYRHGEPLPQLISRADAALYMAKNTGRDKVVAENEVENTDVILGA
jgi:diguanylate cyclase